MGEGLRVLTTPLHVLSEDKYGRWCWNDYLEKWCCRNLLVRCCAIYSRGRGILAGKEAVTGEWQIVPTRRCTC